MIPDASGIFKQVKVPVASLYIAGGTFIVLLIAGLFFASQFFNDQVAQKELDLVGQGFYAFEFLPVLVRLLGLSSMESV